MKLTATTLTIVAILSITPLANADVIDLGDSGWQAVITDPANVGVLIDADTSGFVMIEIIKTFVAPPVDGVFAPITVDFNQIAADGATTAMIWLNDEIITNNTGTAWTDYHWEIIGPAAFQISESSTFDIDPFTNVSWAQIDPNDPNSASVLNVDGGVVGSGETFHPGVDAGVLVIKADLTVEDASFTLTQTPTPEPMTMLILAAGLPLLARRRKRKAATA